MKLCSTSFHRGEKISLSKLSSSRAHRVGAPRVSHKGELPQNFDCWFSSLLHVGLLSYKGGACTFSVKGALISTG